MSSEMFAPIVTATVTGDAGEAVLSGEVESWSINRELVGGSLARFRTTGGRSIGSGGCVVRNPDPLKVAPWSPAADRIESMMSVSLSLSVMATHRHYGLVQLGDWLVKTADGDLSSQRVSLSLLEGQYRGRGAKRSARNQLPLMRAFTPINPAWVIDTLARRCDYYSTPRPDPTTVLSVPFNGAAWAEVGTTANANMSGWGGVRGVLGPSASTIWGAGFDATSTPLRGGNVPLYLTLEATGSLVSITLGADPSNAINIEIEPEGGIARIAQRGAGRPWATTTYTPHLHPDRRDWVQLDIRHTGDLEEGSGDLRIRARPWAGTAWSIYASVAAAPWNPSTYVNVSAVGSVAALSISQDAQQGVGEVNAEVGLLDGEMTVAHIDYDIDAWTAIQDHATAWLAAVHVDSGGTLRTYDRAHLAGAVPESQVRRIMVDTELEDIPWSLSRDSWADRIEVKYRPPELQTATPIKNSDPARREHPILWQASSLIQLAPRETLTITATVDAASWDQQQPSAGESPVPWIALYDAELVSAKRETERSTWSAHYAADGTGGTPSSEALAIQSWPISAGAYKIRIRNRTNSALWLVDEEGDPHLVMRGWATRRQDGEKTEAYGATEEAATALATVDLGKSVQRKADAEAILQYLAARVTTQLATTTVRIVPDWDVDLGSIVRLDHPRSRLDRKALVTGIAMQGQPGEVRQELSLALLAITVWDFDQLHSARTVGEFDALWAGTTVGEFDDIPLSRGA